MDAWSSGLRRLLAVRGLRGVGLRLRGRAREAAQGQADAVGELVELGQAVVALLDAGDVGVGAAQPPFRLLLGHQRLVTAFASLGELVEGGLERVEIGFHRSREGSEVEGCVPRGRCAELLQELGIPHPRDDVTALLAHRQVARRGRCLEADERQGALGVRAFEGLAEAAVPLAQPGDGLVALQANLVGLHLGGAVRLGGGLGVLRRRGRGTRRGSPGGGPSRSADPRPRAGER